MFRKMGIEINENVLIMIIGVVFVPVFVFLIKMIMEVANIRTKLDTFVTHVDETKDTMKKISDFGYEIRAIKVSLADIDDDLKYLFSSVHHEPPLEGRTAAEKDRDSFGSRRVFRKRGVKVEGNEEDAQ